MKKLHQESHALRTLASRYDAMYTHIADAAKFTASHMNQNADE